MSIVDDFNWYRPLTLRTYGDQGNEYLRIGLMSEIGELLGLYKKSRWHGKNVSNEEWMSELGDVAWYATCLMSSQGETSWESGCRLAQSWSVVYEQIDRCRNDESLHVVMTHLTTVGKIEDATEISSAVISVLPYVCVLKGFTLRYVLEANVAKLQKRFPAGFVAYDQRGDHNG